MIPKHMTYENIYHDDTTESDKLALGFGTNLANVCFCGHILNLVQDIVA